MKILYTIIIWSDLILRIIPGYLKDIYNYIIEFIKDVQVNIRINKMNKNAKGWGVCGYVKIKETPLF